VPEKRANETADGMRDRQAATQTRLSAIDHVINSIDELAIKASKLAYLLPCANYGEKGVFGD